MVPTSSWDSQSSSCSWMALVTHGQLLMDDSWTHGQHLWLFVGLWVVDTNTMVERYIVI